VPFLAGCNNQAEQAPQYFVYDNAHADAGGDGSYSMADIKAAMDILRPGQSDIEYMAGSVSGNVFSASRRQDLLND
jgi:hypothetical protein